MKRPRRQTFGEDEGEGIREPLIGTCVLAMELLLLSALRC
jgi:hypothetical protein